MLAKFLIFLIHFRLNLALTNNPTTRPSITPSRIPSSSPSVKPTSSPTTIPTKLPSSLPTTTPTTQPSLSPTRNPSSNPTTAPSSSPVLPPSFSPTAEPTVYSAAVEGDNCHNIFLKGVNFECITYPAVHHGQQYIQIIASNMVDYNLVSLPDEELTIKLPVEAPRTPTTLVMRSQSFFDKLIGVALDGVPMYSALIATGIDIITPKVMSDDYFLRVDECGGSFGKTPDGFRYHYRVMPTCILSRADHVGKRQRHVNDIEELLDAFEIYPGPSILGFSIDGYPIFSPFDSRGHLQEGLDSCNGKFVNGSYGYYVTPVFPYLLACHGPGEYDLAAASANAESLPKKVGVAYDACPTGYYALPTSSGCRPCPAGFHSAVSGCKGKSVCPVGHYCPPASVKPLPCPAGSFGAVEGLISETCSGICKAGYFCPKASKSSDRLPCGGSSVYCPPAAGERFPISPGFYSLPEDADPRHRFAQITCPVSYYCVGGLRYKCPAGTFGSSEALQVPACSGPCPPGYYCPEGSTLPTPCPAGTYGNVSGLSSSLCSGLCEPGHWCPAASVSPRQRQCTGGRVGAGFGLTTSACSSLCENRGDYPPVSSTDDSVQVNITDSLTGVAVLPGYSPFCEPEWCAAGYYCPPGTSRSTQVPCGSPAYYCAIGSAVPTPVDTGYYTVGFYSLPGSPQNNSDSITRTAQVICEPGYWCLAGVRSACPAGVYGATFGLSDAACSGPCSDGYFCPVASSSPTQVACGDPSLYCPLGSPAPTGVPKGFYSVNGSITTKFTIEICPKGTFCIQGIKFLCPPGTYGGRLGLSRPDCDGYCKGGHYCPEMSISATQIPCPAGRYGFPGSIDANCTGTCQAGYFCPLGSASATQNECGSDHLYCPAGSGLPVPVSPGYFSTGGTSTTRVAQVLCLGTALLGTPPAADVRENICPSTTAT